ncbi:MAG: hypothetical protein KAQ68_10450, partial [Clostridiales bacterium]|nr:hypothetical protein [Clostridiales bacterium]
YEISEEDRNKIILLEAFIEKLTGKKMIFQYFEKVTKKNHSYNEISLEHRQNFADNRVGWSFEYRSEESYFESEKMSFDATGIIRTQDGQEIKVSIQLNMSRQFMSHTNIQVLAGDALIDPIVINFDGAAPSLTDTKFVFDLDTDGVDDEISFVNAGSGLLAIDLNEDGIINNGTELFGPNTADGFGELSAYDLDNNNWIDENDAIYDRLQIWTKDANGNDQLFALGQKGVGAIYLGNIDTSFDMKDNNNTMHGQMKSSSIYLANSGNVGIVHQIDLVK